MPVKKIDDFEEFEKMIPKSVLIKQIGKSDWARFIGNPKKELIYYNNPKENEGVLRIYSPQDNILYLSSGDCSSD